MIRNPGSPSNDNRSDEDLLVYLYASPLVHVSKTRAKVAEVQLSKSRELDMIKEKLDRSGRKFRYRCAVATLNNLGERLDEGCTMLHYAGHGNDNCLSFESEEDCGVMKPLHVTSLTNVFRNRSAVPKMVFCASCDSELIGEALVEAGVRHVVAAVRGQVGLIDKVAQDFSAAFYHALIVGGETIKGAFVIARESVNAAAQDAATSFVLLPEGGDHDVKIFDTLPEGKFENLSPPLPLAVNVPVTRREYFGTVPLQRTVEMLCDPNARCISVTGEPGSGKTLRALKACEYVRDRHRFDAIFMAHCKEAVELALSPSRPLPERPEEHMKYLCQLIWTSIDMPPPVPTSPEMLIDSLVGSRNGFPSKVLLFLDDADCLFGSRGNEEHDSLVSFLDKLFCRNPRVRVLLTCEEHLLEGTDIHFQNTLERVSEVKPLQDTEAAQLLLHLFSRDGRGFKFEELGIPRGLAFADSLKAIAKHPVLKVVGGHPGTLVKLGPKLTWNSLANDFDYVKQLAIKIRAEFQDRRRREFCQQRAREIAVTHGLRDKRCRRVWVKAATRAAADGGGILGERASNRGPRWYHLVPLDYLLEELDINLCEVQNDHSGNKNRQRRQEDSVYQPLIGHGELSYLGYQGGASPFAMSFRPRPMEPRDFSFVREILVAKQKAISGGGDHSGLVSIQAFVEFCDWWVEVMATISRVVLDWSATHPIRIHGFVGRGTTEDMLREKGPGTFLIRFSGSQPGLMTFSYNEVSQSGSEALQGGYPSSFIVKHCLVTVHPEGEWEGGGAVYTSLRDLVRDCPQLQKVYPEIPKELAFNDAPTPPKVKPVDAVRTSSPAMPQLLFPAEYVVYIAGVLMGMLGLTVSWLLREF